MTTQNASAPTTTDLPWELAASLFERLPAPNAAAPTDVAGTAADPGATHGDPAADSVATEVLLAPWLQLCSGDDDPHRQLDERLRIVGLTRDDLSGLLTEDPAALRARLSEEPAWHRRFVAWWTRAGAHSDREETYGTSGAAHIHSTDHIHSSTDHIHSTLPDDLALLEVARPLLQSAADELAAGVVRRLTDVDDPALSDPMAMASLLASTCPVAALLGVLSRTLVLELNVARIQGRLAGDSSAERFAGYVALLRDPEAALEIWREYPVLARLVVEALGFWIDTRLELLDALIADLPAIRSQLLDGLGRRITAVEFGAGDTHRRGRSVAHVHFDDDRVVFKPRSFGADLAFDDFVTWVNDVGDQPALRRVRMLDRGTHGWVEFVRTDVATDADGADRYARRIGVLSAMLYVLHATDFHHENILAAGEDPVLVDLEALLHTAATSAMTGLTVGEDPAANALMSSVFSIGLLPVKLVVSADDGTFALDLSAVGGHGGQLTPMAVPVWDEASTDTMHVVNRRVEMNGERNRPLDADGVEIDLLTRGDLVLDGFTATYRTILDRRDELLAADGPLARFGEAAGRLIVRATSLYARLQSESVHPDFCRDALDRDRCLSRLWPGLSGTPYREGAIADEVAELSRGDIPFFALELGTGVLRGGESGQVVGRLPQPPVDTVAERLRALDERDLAFQRNVIVGSFAAAGLGAQERRWPNWRAARRTEPLDDARCLDAASAVAHRLADLAVDGPDRSVGWLGLSLVDEQYWQLCSSAMDLYTGVPGIAHALDTVAAVTADDRLADVAMRAIERVADRMGRLAEQAATTRRKPGESSVGVGAFGVIGGPVYALAHAAARHGRPDLAEPAVALLPLIDRLAEGDTLLDVVSGSAGAILALIALEHAVPGRGALDVADRCADRLLATREDVGDGYGWTTALNPDAPLAGLSHGGSGVAAALAALQLLRPRPEFLDTIGGVLRYERTTFDPAIGNWRDLRLINGPGTANMIAWCHGAPGVALARQDLLRRAGSLGLSDDVVADLDRERHLAVVRTAATGLLDNPVSGVGNHSLCHGDLGNLLSLTDAVDPAVEPELADALPTTWSTLVDHGRGHGWLCGVPDGVETPGLMTGIAGVAWGLARYARPADVPDLLVLAPPARSATGEPAPQPTVAGSAGRILARL